MTHPLHRSRLFNKRLLILVAALLLIGAARTMRLTTFEMHHDEVWSVWQTFGTPAQIVDWTPYDWAPLYYLTLGAWRALVGIHPIVLRFLSVLPALITAAVTYRIGLRLTEKFEGGLLVMLVSTALAFTIYQSVILRGYTLLIMFGTLAFWLMLGYFERPTVRRGVVLGAVLAAMLYTHFSAAFAFAAFGAYTLIVYPRRVPRWLLPAAVLFVLNIPQLPKQNQYLFSQANFGVKTDPIALPQNLYVLFTDFSGGAALILLLAVGIAALAHFRHRPSLRRFIALSVWVLIPVWLYASLSVVRVFTDPVAGTYLPRYFWWLMLPFALWVGWGLSRASRGVIAAAAVALLGVMFLPIPERYQEGVPPFMTNFSLLAKEARWGDVLVIDPSVPDEGAFQWQYFTNVYLPNGVTIADAPGDNRRVWYVSVDGWQDPALFAQMQAEYVPGKFFGPWDFLFRLYEAPPSREGILFDNGMRFHGAELIGMPNPAAASFREGETARLRLWWSVDDPPELDYSVGVYLFDNHYQMRAESNSAPAAADAPPETSRWVSGRYYVEEREFTLPSQITTAVYTFYLSVYQWWDGRRVAADGLNADMLLPLAQFELKTWWLP